ncbi:hypothetical protein IV203_030987 [Nitzschia inconspicua]|uniref:Uncharacterized protein n=1 Tax=Nitzschia inconspicua TaxID=303405 RepID=A0A9K3PA35_9STRA|nr:hypothetical protein IV203_011187 [Nitzschia inconspicua]KAG7368244.1 hypothetical protein IV203_030987 [Nitzschia inconspicua]
METVSAYLPETDNRVKCQAFTIQVEKVNAQKLNKILQQAFTPATKQLLFVPFEGRRSQPADFAQAILSQAALEGKHRIVAIHGIHPDTMFEFEGVLQQAFPQVMKVYSTPTTSYLNTGGEPLGRYNLLCLTTDFPALCVALNSTLADTYRNFIQQTGSGSKTSQTTRDSFLASQHSVIAELGFTIDDIPPEKRSVRPKRHPPIPTTIHAPSQSTPSQSNDPLQAAQTGPPPNPENPGKPSWASVAKKFNTTSPKATETTFPASQVPIPRSQAELEQRQQIALQVKQLLAEQKDEEIKRRDEEIHRQAQQIHSLGQQIQQLIAMVQEMKASPSPPIQDHSHPPSQQIHSPIRKQRRTESNVTPRQGDDMSEMDMSSDGQHHES